MFRLKKPNRWLNYVCSCGPRSASPCSVPAASAAPPSFSAIPELSSVLDRPPPPNSPAQRVWSWVSPDLPVCC